MPLISSLNSGLKLSTNGNSTTLAEVVLPANPIFNSYWSTGSVAANNIVFAGASTTGQAAAFTVNPGPAAANTYGMIIAGKALELFVEYNSSNQFRFVALPSSQIPLATPSATVNYTPTVSQWYSVNTEHTVGVSYNSSGTVLMYVDGDFQSSNSIDPGTFSSDTTTTTGGSNGGLTLGSFAGTTTGTGSAATFNGFIGQVVNFNGPLTPIALAQVTADPLNVASALAGHLEKTALTDPAGSTNQNAFFDSGVGATLANALNAGVSTYTYTNNAGTSTITVGGAGNAAYIRVGDYLTGTGIPDGEFVTSVAGNTIGVRIPLSSGTANATALNLFHPEAVVRTELTASSTPSSSIQNNVVVSGSVTTTLAPGQMILRLDSVAGLKAGDLVNAPGLPAGYTVDATGILAGTDAVIISRSAAAPADLAPYVAATSQIPAGSAISFVDPLAANAKVLTITSSLANSSTGVSAVAGDSIVITAPSSTGATVSRTYTVQASDVLSTVGLTMSKIASSIVNQIPTVGLYATAVSATNPNVIVLAPAINPSVSTLSSALNLTGPTNSQINTALTSLPPLVSSQSLNTARVNENSVLDAVNLSNVLASTTSFTVPTSANAAQNATLANSTATTLTAALGAANPGSTSYSGISNSTTATPELKGPIYAQLNSFSVVGSTATGTYDLLLNPNVNSATTLAVGGNLKSIGFTVTPSTSSPSGTIVSLVPSVVGSLSQANLIAGSMNYQWVSSTGITDFSQPIARLTVTSADSGQANFASTLNNITLNGVLTASTGNPSLPMVEIANLPTQGYSVSGTVYSHYNNGTTTPNVSYSTALSSAAAQAVVIPQIDMTYSVKGGVASSGLLLNLQSTTPVTPLSPNASIKIDVIDNALAPGANNFSYNINMPNNASNVSFTPGVGVSNVQFTPKGGFITISGTYGGSVTTTTTTGTPPVTTTTTAPVTLQNTNTPTLGTLNVTLSNMLTTSNNVVAGKGVSFTIDTPILNGTATSAQSLYFGAAETSAAGTYTLNNLPLGQLALTLYNNPSVANTKSSNIGVNDAMSALSIAAGKGIVSNTAVGSVGNLSVTDFLAADWNQDGRVTAADSLAILQYFTNVSNINSQPLTYRFFPASQDGQTGAGKVTISNAVLPTMTQITTNINASTLGTIGNGGSQTLDIIGVLQGDLAV